MFFSIIDVSLYESFSSPAIFSESSSRLAKNSLWLCCNSSLLTENSFTLSSLSAILPVLLAISVFIAAILSSSSVISLNDDSTRLVKPSSSSLYFSISIFILRIFSTMKSSFCLTELNLIISSDTLAFAAVSLSLFSCPCPSSSSTLASASSLMASCFLLLSAREFLLLFISVI